MTQQIVKWDFAAFVGFDWSEDRHIVSCRESGSEKMELTEIVNKPEVVEEWITGLRNRFPGQRIAVALEQT